MDRVETKGLPWQAALLISALIMVASLLLAKLFVSFGSEQPGAVTALPCSSSQDVRPLGEGVIYSDGTSLHALNSSGRQTWNYLVGHGFSFDAGEDGVAAWTDRSLALLDSRSGAPLFSGTMDEPIISATMGSGYAAVLIGQDEQNSTLIVMEHDGREIDEISLPDLTVLQYGFFSKGSMLWIMSLDTEGTVPMSQLTTYKPGRMQSGKITDSEQVLYQAMFELPKVYTIGTVYARVYDYTGVEDVSRRMLVYGWYLMDTGGSGDNALMAFAPMAQADGERNVSDVRMVCGSVDRTVHLPFPCYALAVRNNRVYGFSEQYIMSIGLNETRATVTQLPVACSAMLGVTEGNEAILVSGDSVYLATLP